MFCVIQEVEVKTVPAGEPKGIEVYESRWTADGKEFCSYEYRNSAERFEHPIRKSYRISIHESFRENGKVKKKQTVFVRLDIMRLWTGATGRGILLSVDWHQKRMHLDWKKANWQT